MRKTVRVTTPFPKPAQVASLLGISKSRAQEIAKLADSLVEEQEAGQQRKSRRGGSSKGAPLKRKAIARTSRTAKR